MEVEHIPCGEKYSLRFGCNTRLCARCGKKYRNRKRQRFAALKRLPSVAGARLKFVTLTFPNQEWPNPDDPKAWMEARTKMLREFLPTRKKDRNPRDCGMIVRGYLAVWEVTPGKSGGRFHPHLHLLIWSDYIHVPEFKRRWCKLTGANVGGQDIRGVRDGGRAVDYLLKYLAKPWAGIPDDLQVACLYRTRRVTSVGEFYGQKFTRWTAACMERSEKFSWVLLCECCGLPSPWDFGEDPADLDACARPWKPGNALGDDEPAPAEWATVRVIELHDHIERSLPAREARMAKVAWNGMPLDVPPETVRVAAGRGLVEAWNAWDSSASESAPVDDVPF